MQYSIIYFLLSLLVNVSCAMGMELSENAPKCPLQSPYGYSSRQGRKSENRYEDRCAAIKIDQGELFVLFDGHGQDGHEAADKAIENIARIFTKQLSRYKSIKKVLEKTFISLDTKIREQTDSGTTAIVAYIRENNLYLAWAGDSRGIVIRNGKVVLATQDHKPHLEKMRIQEMIADFNTLNPSSKPLAYEKVVKSGRVSRIAGLALSRSLGDAECKTKFPIHFITPKPDVMYLQLEPGDVILLACDGVWDVLDNQTACDLITQGIQATAGVANTLDNTLTIENKLINSAKLTINPIPRLEQSDEDGNEDNIRLCYLARGLVNAAYAVEKNHDNITALLVEYPV